VVRFWLACSGAPPDEEVVEARRHAGYAALDAVESYLTDHMFFVDERFTIADISLTA
jgi:glutathione S-transferase